MYICIERERERERIICICREREKEDICTVGERERDSNHNCLGSTYSFDSLVDFFFIAGT
jgi:hypothetical protein